MPSSARACCGPAKPTAATTAAAIPNLRASVMRQPHLLEQALGVVDLVHHPAHVARIDVDRTGQVWIEDPVGAQAPVVRSEARRVGKECFSRVRSRWARY